MNNFSFYKPIEFLNPALQSVSLLPGHLAIITPTPTITLSLHDPVT